MAWLAPGKVHGVVGITGDPTILILDDLTHPSGSVCVQSTGVECRVSIRSGALFVLASSVRPSGVTYGG